MNHQPIIGIYAPHPNGGYYGTLIKAIHRSVAAAGGRVLLIQTDEAGNGTKTAFDYPLAFDYLDGWIMLVDALADRVLHRFRRRKIPFVCIGHNAVRCDYPVIRPDNFPGMRRLVEHLIDDHGHRDIAFVGKLSHRDIASRFQGYRAALSSRGIPFRQANVIDVPDNLYSGGEAAAAELLSRKLGCTAVVCGVDANAAGLIERLRGRGYAIPGDLTVTGFDDMPIASMFEPPLSSVNLHLEEQARAAVDIVLHSRADKADTRYVPCRQVIRSSCGCPETGRNEGRLMTAKVLFTLENIINRNNMIGRSLMQAQSGSIKSLGWLADTKVSWACYAQFPEHGPRDRVEILSVFSRDGTVSALQGETVPLEAFPSLPDIPAYDDANEILTLHIIRTDKADLGVLAMVGNHEEGSIWYNLNTTMSQLFPLMAAALERESLFERLEAEERHHRSLAEKLDIVSRSSSDGIWEWQVGSNVVEWSERLGEMFGLDSSRRPSHIENIGRLVHPDDHPLVNELTTRGRDNPTFRLEIRMRHASGDYLWVLCSGEILFDAEGGQSRYVGSIQDITERKAYERRISYLAYHDSLTGLHNRTYLMERLAAETKAGAGEARKLALILLDLDHFKLINDTYGHRVGDKVLVSVAGRLRSEAPEEAAIVRMGGDEFIILYPGAGDKDEVERFGQRLGESLRSVFVIDNHEFYLSGSLGIAYYPENGTDGDTLLQSADIAMYTAKSRGRDKVQRFYEAMNDATVERHLIGTQLRKAVLAESFELHYQPQLRLSDRRVFGAEALIRWRLPGEKLVYPQDFIPVAEETGLIVPIGYWALREACRQYRAWAGEGYHLEKLSVNISAIQFGQPDFVARTRAIVEEAGMDGGKLIFEITESTVMRDIDYSVKVLRELAGLGIEIALDDFGTGYSSLSLLGNLPLHWVKIDKSFLKNLDNPRDRAIVEAIVHMTRSLRLMSIAEGVETERDEAVIKKMGCDAYQGYYLGRPVDSTRFKGSIACT